MFEHKQHTVIPVKAFYRRMFFFLLMVLCIIVFSIIVGVLGYHYICHFSWTDSFLNACMILTGMGQINELKTRTAKIFASLYALFSGLVILANITIIVSPVIHRILHKFHVSDSDISE